MEKLNWFFHQEMHYLNRDIAEKTAELQEYQRIAVLVSLDAIHSDLLPQYLERAKQDGRNGWRPVRPERRSAGIPEVRRLCPQYLYSGSHLLVEKPVEFLSADK